MADDADERFDASFQRARELVPGMLMAYLRGDFHGQVLLCRTILELDEIEPADAVTIVATVSAEIIRAFCTWYDMDSETVLGVIAEAGANRPQPLVSDT